ncbi:MAG: peptidoglycan-binding domain-containing protein [Desulfobacterales bacterium]|nr:peptidoglycan-binding domain-containing protein [Desulfobacterales bacterium]
MRPYRYLMIMLCILAAGSNGHAYPLDGYDATGIRRVEAARLSVLGKLRGRAQPPGARLPLEMVDLRLQDMPDFELPAPDPGFTDEVQALLGEKAGKYGLAVLDLSDPQNPRLALHRADHKQNVGSVGKIVAAVGIFQALADVYPDDVEARRRILQETIITADAFIQHDHHEVRIWDLKAGKLSFRPLQLGDQGTFYEWLDWMLSASSNAAASTVMKHGMLLRHFGRDYPVSEEEARRFFKETPKAELGSLYAETFTTSLERNGLDTASLRQGSFFTRHGKGQVPGTTSYGTALELMRYFVKMEQGRLIDVFSSREIKRLLYMTERRIRYASAPILKDSAVYFKSGSLYSCKPEPGFACKKYHGNVRNYMNSMAVVETPAGVKRLHYMATLISNVLYKNSAVEHQTLGTYIHKLIEAAHPPQATPPGQLPEDITFGRNLIGFGAEQEKRLQVAEVQSLLAGLGYKVEKIDGKLGPKTAGAIKAFQKDHQLKVDGKVTDSLLEKLRAVKAGSGQ